MHSVDCVLLELERDMNKEWNRISSEFCEKMAACNFKKNEHFTGTLAGSPLRQSKITIIGINWGGNDRACKIHQWIETEPSACQLFDDNEGSFGGQISQIFNRCLGNDWQNLKDKVKNELFWTNSILVRSPQITSEDWQMILAAARKPSECAVRHMLQIVCPRLILCFGKNDPSRLIFNNCMQNSASPELFPCGTSYIYRRTGRIRYLNREDDAVEAWSFPHPGREALWLRPICGSEDAMKNLGNTIKVMFK
jgi:hypothetical protein